MAQSRGFYAVHDLFFIVKKGRVGVNVKILWPTDRSKKFGRTKLLSDFETGRSVIKYFGRTKSIIDSSIFHTKERAVNRVV